MLDVAQHAKKMIREDGDTCGWLMHMILRDEAEALMGLERYQEAARSYKESELINDTLGRQYSQALITTVREAVMQEHELSRHNMFIVILVSGVIFLLVVGGILVYHDRVQHRRNQAMAHNIRKLMYYREQVLKHPEKEKKADETEQTEEADPEKRRFEAVDHQIMKEELFHDPNFGRDELMRLLGVDKNNLATIIQRYTGTNVTGYVNGKRMEYAVLLMKEHPEYTLAAIAEACGIKSPATFIRNFRGTYDLTPSEYRKSLEELPPLNRTK
jgi:AraC-like DNA-binding protein